MILLRNESKRYDILLQHSLVYVMWIVEGDGGNKDAMSRMWQKHDTGSSRAHYDRRV